jgi:hypothetical protein
MDVDIDVDEDEKLAMKLAEEEAKRVPMKRLRSRSGTTSNHQGSDFIRPAHVDEDLLATSGPGIKRSDSSRSLTRKKRMRIDSSPIMEDSLALPLEEVKHSPPSCYLGRSCCDCRTWFRSGERFRNQRDALRFYVHHGGFTPNVQDGEDPGG